jgi:hypothetical protein
MVGDASTISMVNGGTTVPQPVISPLSKLSWIVLLGIFDQIARMLSSLELRRKVISPVRCKWEQSPTKSPGSLE